MALEKYKQKRSFNITPEPTGGKGAQTELRYVIQKHAASHLHYDFRLEMEGVLKSWAVPKGPSTDPAIKRLAMMVEDHPFDYRTFEGIIPAGQYGGGTVIVWDEGTYEPIEEIKEKKAQETHLLKQLKEGSLKIKLHGKKLQGEFALVKTHGMGENGWLLIKHKDEHAAKTDITKNDKSVLSGKTLEAIAKSSDNIWNSNKPGKTGKKQSAKALKDSVALPVGNASDILKNAPKTASPAAFKPMLATLVDKPFDDPDWLYEIKWDGYRAVALVNKGKVELISRNKKSFDAKFYPVHQALTKWKINAVLDGELVVLNDKGRSDFGSLQNWRSEADGELVFYVFDMLWYDGKNLVDLPLRERRTVLEEMLPAEDMIRLSKTFDASGTDFFDAASKMELEGIIAKKANSTYSPDRRSKEWLKIKINKRQEVIIAGFTRNEGSAKTFSSLLLGVYEHGSLQYAGKVGTGFSDKLQKEMMAMFKPLIVAESPFNHVPDYNKPSRFRPNPPKANATWLKPELVCEVSFTEVTGDGVFRHPSFEGMRVDKNAKDVVREIALHTEEVVEEEHELVKKKIISPSKGKVRKTLLNPKDETQVRKVCGHDLKFTNLSKLYWPEDGVTKRDMFNYYYQVAEYILPYLKDRPQSLNRFPNGIHGKSFYQKNIKDKAPDWAETFPYVTSDGEPKEYLVGNDEASLLWMASLGCIEMNPWFSRIQSPDHPDWCIIDLDPDKNTFDQVIEAAQVVKKVLDAMDVPCYCKTSGSTGIHIYIPMGAKYTYDQSQLFARLIVNMVHKELPDYTSLERHIKNRDGKMYLDFLQNRPGATIAGPYSLRPKPGATVSMPLHWDEVKKGLKMKDFTIFNSIQRLKEVGDIFKPALGNGIDLEKALAKLQSLK
ncbi:MAG TPA: DNA ligase D [Sphingobacteriaceae bacterium]|nr:DNA ligase D [Sphingobacteriaceae bacterium]